MMCPRCSAESPWGQKFCGECGTALVVVCGSCGTASSAGRKFCGECGAALALAAGPGVPAGAGAGPVAERRVCSVLFCDVVGFTPVVGGAGSGGGPRAAVGVLRGGADGDHPVRRG